MRFIFYEYSSLHLLYCTWFGYIKSYTEDSSHVFFASRLLVHNQFVCLSNPLEVVVHYLPIGGMVGLGHQDGILIVSTLVYIVTHWTRPMIIHDIRY